MMKRRIYEILEKQGDTSGIGFGFNVFIISLISLNVIAVIVESIERVYVNYHFFFKAFEVFSVIVFTIEYSLRIWTTTLNPKFRHPLWGRIKFALTPLALIDLLAILPFYLPFIVKIDLRFLRAIRLIRLFRLFKLGRYTRAINTFARVLSAKKEDLSIALFAVLILIVLVSSLLYLVENHSGIAAFSSIPSAIWWSVARLTSLGYSDIYPMSITGKLLAILVAVIGIGLFAVIGGILGSGFVEVIQGKHKEVTVCPHCGKRIDQV